MTLHRIYTEDKNREQIYAILDSYCAGYTVLFGVGAWEVVREASLCIELVDSDDTFGPLAECVAEKIKAANEQESVMIVFLPCTVQFR